MRYSYPPILEPVLSLERSIKEWSITRLLLLLGTPLMAAILLVMTFSIYRISTNYLNRAYARNAQTRALAQAHELKQLLAEARHEIQFLAQSKPSPDSISAYLMRKPASQRNRYREFAFHGALPEDNFVLLNTGEKIVPLSVEQAAGSKFGVFSRPKQTDQNDDNLVQIDQPTQTYYTSIPFRGATQNMEFSVIRLSTVVVDETGKPKGSFTLSVDMTELQRIMSVYNSNNSPLYIFPQEKENTSSFFFDESGWILFESGYQENKVAKLSIDNLRSGLEGDIGRAGFDSAFRPSAKHEKYWTMVSAVQSGQSGQLALGPLFNEPSNPERDFFLNYVPIDFQEGTDSPPVIIGGIGCMDTSFLFKSATYEIVMALSVAMVVAMVLCLGAFFYLNRRISRPLAKLSAATESRALGDETSHLDLSPLPKEMFHLQHIINILLLHVQTARNEASIRHNLVVEEAQRQPVSLNELIASNHLMDQKLANEPMCGIVGGSQAVRNLRTMIVKASSVMADVLVIGETGTGKELTAEAIHRSSARAKGPFISINCGALDENLLLDALFGHIKGAFTEAKSDRKGAFLAASGGTLHLDEIGNASAKVQQALLRALSVRHIRPLGSDQDQPFDARVIAATNVDLLECARNGTFREDLYYRLAVITINTPPLRNRREDIPALIRFFLQETCASLGKKPLELSRGALDKLLRHSWPGNVREMKNCITRAITFAEGDILLAEHLVTDDANPEPIMQNESDIAQYESETIVSQFASSPTETRTPGNPEPVRHISASTPADSSKQSTTAVSIPDNLNSRQRAAWPGILAAGGTNRALYQSATGQEISVRTAQYDLQDFVNKGLLVKSGKGPSSRYVIVRQTT